MPLFINFVRYSIYRRERVEKSDWENESGPPHVEITNGGGALVGKGAVGDRGCNDGRWENESEIGGI